MGDLTLDGDFVDCKESFHINPNCMGALKEYLDLNPCDQQRGNAFEAFTRDPSLDWAKFKLDFFLYAICENGCDCIPQIGADMHKPEIDLHRGNCPAHANADICKVFPNIKLIHLNGTENDSDTLPNVCPDLAEWKLSPASSGWPSKSYVEFSEEIEYFLERAVEATEVVSDRVVWDYCFDMETKQERILPLKTLGEQSTTTTTAMPAPTTTTTMPETTPLGESGKQSGFLGCYRDSEDRALPVMKGRFNNTLETCTEKCHSANFAYAGLQWKGQCWCGNDEYDKHGEASGCICDGPNFGLWMFCAYATGK